MLNDWFTDLSFETDWETFRELPRHPAYRYEFKDDRCSISGRPVFFHAKRDLNCLIKSNCDHEENPWEISQIEHADCSELVHLFDRAFSRSAPFIHLSAARQLAAAQALLQRTQQGEDGPIFDAASLVIRDAKSQESLGAILITLVPSDDFINFNPEQWSQEPPADAVKNGWGQPHLTWIFIDPHVARQGLGKTLLRSSAQHLLDSGYTTLVSTFLSGNQASTLWHWKMGFQLLSHVSSR